MKDPKFLLAIAAYLGLAFAAWRTLESELLWATWILLGILAVKTVVVVLKRRLD
jgi:hypothetical protein